MLVLRKGGGGDGLRPRGHGEALVRLPCGVKQQGFAVGGIQHAVDAFVSRAACLHGCKRPAAGKRHIAQLFQRIRQREAAELRAVQKRAVADRPQPGGEMHLPQHGQVGARPRADGLHARGHVQRLHGAAARERPRPDPGHAAADRDVQHAFGVIVPRHVQAGVPVVHVALAVNGQRARVVQRPGEGFAAGPVGNGLGADGDPPGRQQPQDQQTGAEQISEFFHRMTSVSGTGSSCPVGSCRTSRGQNCSASAEIREKCTFSTVKLRSLPDRSPWTCPK